MNRRERLVAAMTGGRPDRVPVSAWGHWYDREVGAASFAEVTAAFQRAYDWDLVKLHARASYHVEGFGFRFEPSTEPGRPHRTLGTPIREASDWRRLRPLTLKDPALAEQIEAIRLVRAHVEPDVPMIMTVFLPLDVADKLVDRDSALLRRHIEEDEAAVIAGLETIAESFVPFVAAVAASGVDGVFFSTKWANARRLPLATYERVARALDLRVIAAARGLSCNMLHLCEDGIHLAGLADYPVACLHWETHGANNPGVAHGQGVLRPEQSVGGGVDPATLARGTPEDVTRKAREAIAQCGGTRFVLGPGCSIDTAGTPRANLMALRRAVDA